jgi:hypothetical protein
MRHPKEGAPSKRATRLALSIGVPVALMVGAQAVSWAATTLKTWNDGDTLTAADLNANFAALSTAIAAGPQVAVTPPLSGNGSAQSPLRVKSIYQVWGRTTCGTGDSVVHTGFVGAFGANQGAMGGEAMCLDDTLANGSWVPWSGALVSRARSGSSTAGDRSEYMSTGDMKCAVCKGYSYTLWGRTKCDAGDTVLYAGHIGHFNYNATSGGGNNAGPFCIDDAVQGTTWITWGGNSMLVRASGANAASYSQYLEARDGTCVVCQ